MSSEYIQPTPLLSSKQYEELASSAPGMDIQSLRRVDNKLSKDAARTADYFWYPTLTAFIVSAISILNSESNVSGKFASLFLSLQIAGHGGRGLNELIYRGITKPLAKARLNNGLNQFKQSERIPNS